MTDGPSSEEITARLEVAKARTDTKFAQLLGEMRAGFAGLEGKMNALGARMESVERSTSGLMASIVIAGIAVVAALVAVLADGQTWIGMGVSTRDIVRATVIETLQQQQVTHPE